MYIVRKNDKGALESTHMCVVKLKGNTTGTKERVDGNGGKIYFSLNFPCMV